MVDFFAPNSTGRW